MLGEAKIEEKAVITNDRDRNGFLGSVVHEASAIAAVTMGFSTDPVARWMYPEPAAYFRWFPRFVRAFGGWALADGTAFCTSTYSGAALWLRPDRQPDEAAMVELVRRSFAGQKHDAVLELFEKMADYHPTEPHWYLPMIGVDTCRQNMGIGTALMSAALKVVDAEGTAAYLESSNPRNISLYKRFGFETLGEISAGGAPPIVPMLRKPQR